MDSYLASAAGYRFLPPALVVIASVAYRLPRLAHAGDLHSDAAVVGLQAAHFLRGEWSPLLWGSGYQTSVDSVVAALFFVLFGPTALALRLSTFVGFLTLTLLAYATLRRHLSPVKAALLVSPLVLTPTPVHTYVFSPPRQAALTLVFLAIFLLDGAALGRRGSLFLLGLGATALGLSCFADPYALLFLPSIACVAVPAVFARRDAATRLAVALAGGAVGLLPFVMLLSRPESTHGVFGLTTGAMLRNSGLLLRDCLPFLLSLKVFMPSSDGTWTPWVAPTWFSGVQVFGAVGIVMAIAAGGGFAALRTAPPALARLGMAGAAMLPLALIGFLFSVMPMDHFSARYLVAIILMAPFALAPVVERIGSPVLAAVIAPYLASSAAAGWLGYGNEVTRLRSTAPIAMEADDRALLDTLSTRGITRALADYWASYRLTFLSGERIVVVPWHQSQDRYTPYRESVAAASTIAYLYHPVQSLERLSDREALFKSGATAYLPDFETIRAGRYTVLVLRRNGGRETLPPVFHR
jgi:hypothetical protein